MSVRNSCLAARTGLQGHLRLTASADDQGRTYLREQSFSAPAHLSKTFSDQGVLIANMVNPTAGLLEGDRLEIDIRVEQGARFLLTTPAATRIHTMKNGKAVQTQKFSVAEGGWLEVWPDLFIPQAGSNYEQKTEIRVESGGELLFFEILTPGRVASGEAFAFHRLDWETDIFFDQTLVVRERYVLTPDSASLYPLQARFPQAYQANCFVLTEALSEKSPCWRELLALQCDDILIGFSGLVRGGWVVKVLARDSLFLRQAIETIRHAILASAAWPRVTLRKN